MRICIAEKWMDENVPWLLWVSSFRRIDQSFLLSYLLKSVLNNVLFCHSSLNLCNNSIELFFMCSPLTQLVECMTVNHDAGSSILPGRGYWIILSHWCSGLAWTPPKRQVASSNLAWDMSLPHLRIQYTIWSLLKAGGDYLLDEQAIRELLWSWAVLAGNNFYRTSAIS